MLVQAMERPSAWSYPACYGIKTVAINEDTPNDPELWKVWPSWWSSLAAVDVILSRTYSKGSFLHFWFNLNNFACFLVTCLVSRALYNKNICSESGSHEFISTRLTSSILLELKNMAYSGLSSSRISRIKSKGLRRRPRRSANVSWTRSERDRRLCELDTLPVGDSNSLEDDLNEMNHIKINKKYPCSR